MPMGIVSDNDFAKELAKSSPIPTTTNDSNKDESTNESNSGKVVNIKRGRAPGDIETPNSLRRLIGQTSIEEGRSAALNLGQAFGVSPSSVSSYSVGATSTDSYNQRPNGDVIDKTKNRVSTRARNKLMMALRHITEDKLVDTKARELAGIAKDMSAVIKNMEPSNPNGPQNVNGPTFIFYSPRQREEKEFNVIDAQE